MSTPRSAPPQAGLTYICGADELAVGEIRRITVDGRSWALVRTPDAFFAVGTKCAHQGADLMGSRQLQGTIVDGQVGAFCYGMDAQVLRCPWHNWEYDVTTGESLHDRRRRLASRPVTVIDGALYM
jgi:nitrite reductase/ring-hydroxylating ferredoxin subunit